MVSGIRSGTPAWIRRVLRAHLRGSAWAAYGPRSLVPWIFFTMSWVNYARLRLFIRDIRFSRETQNSSEATPWGFDSPSRHQIIPEYLFWFVLFVAEGRFFCVDGVG